MSDQKQKLDLGVLEEDDEFEEFPVEDWTGKDKDEQDISVWEDNWEDDNIEDDFNKQLSAMRNNCRTYDFCKPGPSTCSLKRGKVGKITRNPFLNFLRDIRKTYSNLSMVDQAVKAGRLWRRMSPTEKTPYYNLAKHVRPSPRKKYKHKWRKQFMSALDFCKSRQNFTEKPFRRHS